MGDEQKADNKKDKLAGKAKEAVGKVTGDDSLERQGKNDQSKASIKDAGENIKDAFKR